MIAEIILAFQSKTVAKGDIRADSPIVLNVQPGVKISNVCDRVAYGHRVKTRAASLSDRVLKIRLRISRSQALQRDEVSI